MSAQEYLETKQKIQESFLDFLDNETTIEENFKNLTTLLNDQNIRDNKQELRLFLNFLMAISNNHHRGNNFFSKIERILQLFTKDIQNNYSNTEIFDIFKSNKRILLFIIEEKLLIIDQEIVQKLNCDRFLNNQYPQYFSRELQPLLNEEWFPKNDDYSTKSLINEIKKELPENYEELRKIGENEQEICKLIQKDSIKEFIVYINQNNFPLDSEIKPSIFETNEFLLKKQKSYDKKSSLIEYATFFGSIQIFQYLKNEGVKLTPSLWEYSIHGQNSEMIHLLEENQIEPEIAVKINYYEKEKIVSYTECLNESIKCHHNDITNYLQNYLIKKDNEKNPFDILVKSIEYFNFNLINNELVDDVSFYYFCKYDYYALVDLIMKTMNIDVNRILFNFLNVIQNFNRLIQLKKIYI